MKTFSEKFEQNANLQLRKVTRAIDLYVKNVYIKSRLVRYVNSQNGFGMMQPLALKNFSDVVYSYLEPIIGSDNISMFTVVVDKYNFGQDNWNFQYKSFQKKIKKIFKGYDYIANVALDEFPRISFQQDGTLMTPHIHGIFFRTLTRWEKSKLTKAIYEKDVNGIVVQVDGKNKIKYLIDLIKVYQNIPNIKLTSLERSSDVSVEYINIDELSEEQKKEIERNIIAVREKTVLEHLPQKFADAIKQKIEKVSSKKISSYIASYHLSTLMKKLGWKSNKEYRTTNKTYGRDYYTEKARVELFKKIDEDYESIVRLSNAHFVE